MKLPRWIRFLPRVSKSVFHSLISNLFPNESHKIRRLFPVLEPGNKKILISGWKTRELTLDAKLASQVLRVKQLEAEKWRRGDEDEAIAGEERRFKRVS